MSKLYPHGDQVYIRFTKAEGITPRLQNTGYRLEKGKIPQAAINWHKKLESEIVEGKWGINVPSREDLTMSQARDLYLETRGSNNAKNSKKSTRLAVSRFIGFAGDVMVSKVTEDMMFGFRNHLLNDKVSKFTVDNYLRTIAPIFTMCIKKRIIQFSPVTPETKLNPKPKNPRPYRSNELKALYKYIRQEMKNEPLYDQLRFLELTGFRSQESCDLLWSQVLFDRKIIDYSNQKRENEEAFFPLYNKVLKHLKAVPRVFDPFVFKYRNPKTLRDFVRTANDEIGNPTELAVKHLRKNFVNWLFDDLKLDIADVKEIARHKDIKTTLNHYKHRSTMRLLVKLNRSSKPNRPHKKQNVKQ